MSCAPCRYRTVYRLIPRRYTEKGELEALFFTIQTTKIWFLTLSTLWCMLIVIHHCSVLIGTRTNNLLHDVLFAERNALLCFKKKAESFTIDPPRIKQPARAKSAYRIIC